MGRSRKYTYVFEFLEPERVYSPSCIAKLMEERKLAPFDKPMSEAERRTNRKRISTTMAWWMRGQERPEMGDGLVKIHGQRPMPGWFGWRWQGRDNAPEASAETEGDHAKPMALVS